MTRLGTVTAALVCLYVASVISSGCGGNESQPFTDGPKDAGGAADANDAGGVGNNGGGWSDAPNDSGGVIVQDAGTDPQCASAGKEAKLATVNLVFMFDRSGSMVVGPGGAPLQDVKWKPIVAAAKAFFIDDKSRGINASLSFFSQAGYEYSDKTGICGKAGTEYTEECCASQTYSQAKVGLRPIPSPDFAPALDAADPAGATPTYPALQGAVAQAKAVAQTPAHQGQKTVIVLATDGNPEDDCNTASSVSNVSVVARTAVQSDGIKTYVIGVNTPGQSGLKANLDYIANAGGTGQAIMVDVNDAEATKRAFINALNQIRSELTSCDLPIPPPPTGKTFDKRATNVFLRSTAGRIVPVLFNETCGEGWKYDNWDDPKTITLCPTSCINLRNSGGSVDIQFGCPTQTPSGPIIK